MLLSRFPRIRLGHLDTPLEPLTRLSAHLGGPNLYIKRDDCTGLATGGNKTRKLEFLMADALAQKADTVITQGATQSNHARQTAAAAARLGLKCKILLEDRTGYRNADYVESGAGWANVGYIVNDEFTLVKPSENVSSPWHTLETPMPPRISTTSPTRLR